MSFSFEPIGFVRSPFVEKKDAPRQTAAARDVTGTIELVPSAEMRDALSDLAEWSHLWVIFVFHDRKEGWSPKVQPPRSDVKRGVFATRSPHRPNPIGISVVRLLRIEDCTLHISDLDMIDGTPVLDIKPYVPYADAIANANDGWLREDPREAWSVSFEERAKQTLAWLADRGVDLEEAITTALALGPQPHAYRRIKRDGETSILAIKDWRVRFTHADRTIRVLAIESGYREGQEMPTIHAELKKMEPR